MEDMRRGRGTATFVLGDVVGSTRMWAEDTDAMPDVLGSLDEVVNSYLLRYDGERPPEQGEGDSFLAVFPAAASAAAFALDVQRALRESPVAVRVGVHTGDALQRDDGRWMGQAVGRAARLRDVASGGQILVSGATAELVVEALPEGAWLKDLGSHRLKDLARAEYVRQLCHPDLESDFPPLRSLDKLPHNLPVELDLFVGREAELRAIDDILGKARMVTLTGAGGAGKTRLAVHAAAARVETMPDGAWLADLAPIVDPSLVPKVLASAMRLSEQSLQPIADTVVARLFDATALVVLDNCEHLLDATASLAERLLRECPGVVVIATSREPLGVEGEVVYRVPSMTLPAADDDATCESVRLFEERARAVRPTFALDATTLPAVIRLCRRVDGLPLAVELAAARCRAMSPAEIVAQLEKRMNVLSAGRRGALPRQRTLEASVEWSYDLLADAEQRLLRRLSVFAGGFDLEGAESVGSGDGLDAWHVVDVLTALVDKSLVQAENAGDRTRYRLLETIRVFAAQRLAGADEMTAARVRHLDHMIGVAEVFEREIDGPDGMVASDRLRVETDNLRAALDWAIECGRADAAWRLSAAASMFMVFDLFGEARERAQTLIALGGGSAADRVVTFVTLSWACWFLGDLATARSLVPLAEASAGDDELLVAVCDYIAGSLEVIGGDVGVAQRLERAIPILDSADAFRFFSWDAQSGRVLIDLGAGRLRKAFDEAEGLIERTRGSGSVFGLGTLLTTYIIAAQRMGHYARAEAACDELERIQFDRMGLIGRSLLQIFRTGNLSAAGRHDEALALIEDAVAEARRYAMLPMLLGASGTKLSVAARAGRPVADALEEFERCHESFFDYGSQVLISCARALVAAGSGARADAERFAALALSQAKVSPLARASLGPALRASSAVALIGGDAGRAEDFAHEAVDQAISSGGFAGAVESLDTLAMALAALHRDEEAVRIFAASGAVRAEIGYVRGVREIAGIERVTTELRARLGDDLYESAFAEGSVLSAEEALAYASRGRGERKRPAHGWASLTPAERDVTDLAARGLRNKDIAEKLFVTPATVKTHLAHVFAKLGVRTRAELAAFVAEVAGRTS